MFLRAILAAILGTLVMDLSSNTEMHWRGRSASVVPGQGANKLLRLVGVPQLEGRALRILSHWTHWLYGTSWGIVFWLLVDPAGLNTAVAGVIYFFIVWIAEQIHLPLLGLGIPPSWKWGLKENLIDAWHHMAYAAGTAFFYWLLQFVA